MTRGFRPLVTICASMLGKYGTYFWLIFALLTVTSCSIPAVTGGGSIPFTEIFENRSDDEYQLVRTQELDVDGDDQDEWVVIYQFDPTQREDWNNAPMQAVVYDAINCDPPLIQRWMLPFPDNDTIGEGGDATAGVEDWLANGTNSTSPEGELILQSEGDVNVLSLYRWRDELRNPCLPPDPTKQGFQLMGFFRANGLIEYNDQNKIITTYQRTQYERSQLAIKSNYAPNRDANGAESYVDANGNPKRADEQTIDFMYGMPNSPVDSPFPEKAVAAFYLSMGVDRNNSFAQSFLTPELQQVFNERQWGTGYTPGQLKRVLIYSISYTPDREAERARLDRTVKITVVPVDLNNQRQEGREITLRLKGYPIPDSQDCEWRIAEVTGVIVTPGLGMNDVQEGLGAIAGLFH